MVDPKYREDISPGIQPGGWYKPGSSDEPDSDYSNNENSGESDDSRSKSLSDTDLKDAENKDSPSANEDDPEDDEKDNLGLYKQPDDSNKSKKRGGFKLNSKKGIGGMVLGTIIGGLIMFSVQAPGLVLNHLKEMLLGRISSVQMHHQRRYRQSRIGKIKNLFSRDGRLAQKMISEMEADGYKVNFDKKANRILGLTSPDGTSMIGNGIGDHVDAYMEKKHPFRSARWKTRRMDALINKFKISRSSVVDIDKARDGPDGKPVDPDTVTNKEMAGEILEGDENIKIKNTASATETAEDAAEREALDESGGELAENANEIKNKLIDGENMDNIDNPLADSFNGMSSGIGTDALDTAEEIATSGSIGSKAFSTLKSFLSPLDILDKVCTTRNRISASLQLSRAARAVKLIRYSMVFINAADAIRQGRGSPKLINSLMKRVVSKDKNGVSIGGSSGFGYLLKNKFKKSKNDISKTNVGVDGKLTGVPKVVNDNLSKIPGLDSGCPYVQNPIVQTGAAVVGIVVGFFSGGSSVAAEEGAVVALTETINIAIREALQKVLTRQFALRIASGFAVEIGFEGIMVLMQMYIEKNLVLPFTGQEKGGQLGDILVAGAGASNKQRSLAAGMVPATSQEYAMAQGEYIAWNKQELSKKSFSERMLSMDTTDSLAVQTIYNMPIGLQNTATTVLSGPLSLFNSLTRPDKFLGSMFSSVTPKALAEDEEDISYDTYKINDGDSSGTELATDPAGNLQVIMRSDIESIDTDSNIEDLKNMGEIDRDTLEPIGKNFKAHIENCIDTPDLLTKIETNTDDCLAKKDITKKFKAHLAYLDMADGLEAEFDPENISTGSNTATAANTPSTPSVAIADSGTGPVDISQTSEIPNSGGKRINTTILPQFTAMLDAAKADGINLLPISSAWRDPQKQIELRKQNCPDWQNSPPSACSPPTAKPGTSNHEGGRAIDFGDMCFSTGGATSCSGNTRWEWLVAHASKYGFSQLKSEAWHWSTTGH